MALEFAEGREQMKALKGFVLIFVGIAWALLWTVILASINDHDYSIDLELLVIQLLCVFAILIGVIPFGFGVSRLAGE
jgi:hypothetical protein